MQTVPMPRTPNHDQDAWPLSPESRAKLSATEEREMYALLSRIASQDTEIAQLRSLVYTDAKTGVESQRYFDHRVLPELVRFVQGERRAFPASYVIGLTDINDLTMLNTTLGHPGADRVIQATAQAMQGVLKPTDVLWRCGGDEFGIVLRLREQDPASVASVIDMVQDRIQTVLLNNHPKTQRVSAGFVVLSEFDSVEEAFEAADRKMYEDKAAQKSGMAQLGAQSVAQSVIIGEATEK